MTDAAIVCRGRARPRREEGVSFHGELRRGEQYQSRLQSGGVATGDMVWHFWVWYLIDIASSIFMAVNYNMCHS